MWNARVQKCFPPRLSERLTETLRMNPSAAVSAQIFLMFRVLLLRISSQHLTSLWPIMVTELVRPPPSDPLALSINGTHLKVAYK